MSDLKPCPFCGSNDIDHLCRTCGAAPGDTGADRWNTRPIEDALAAKLARYRAAWKEMNAAAQKAHDGKMLTETLPIILQHIARRHGLEE